MGMEIEMLDQTDEVLGPAQPVAMLEPAARAVVALKSTETELALRALVIKHKGITEVKNKAGRDQAHGAAMELTRARTDITKAGKAARDDALKFSKAVIAEEERLIGIIQSEETRLKGLRDTWDTMEHERKEAEARAERDRVMAITQRISDIKAYAGLAMQCRTSERVTGLIAKVADMAITAELFAEFEDQAIEAKRVTMEQMEQVEQRLQADEVERSRVKAEQEAAAAQLAAQRAELERQQAEAAATQARAAAELRAAQEAHAAELRAAQEAQALAEQEAAQARAAAEAEAQAKRDAEAAELQRQRDAFAAEQVAARAAQQAEAERLQAQADELARQRAELETKPDQASVERSSAAIENEADHFPDAGNMVIEKTADPAEEAETASDIAPITLPAFAPSDAEIICTAADAVATAYGWTFGQAVERLSTLEWAPN